MISYVVLLSEREKTVPRVECIRGERRARRVVMVMLREASRINFILVNTLVEQILIHYLGTLNYK